MSEIKYYKNTLWLKPFVDSVKSLVDHDKIKLIRGYSVQPGKERTQYGSIIRYNDDTYTINLKLYSYNKNLKKQVPDDYEIILCTLAHELAHTKHWIHKPEHFKLFSLILLRFCRIMKKLNIKDTNQAWK